MRDLTGTTISQYRILEKLGVGGMGVVYKAEDTQLKRTVALKFLPSEYASDIAARERFVQEARAASALDHPNICTIHEIGETEDGQSYFTMACYEGISLKDRIAGLGVGVHRDAPKTDTPLRPPLAGADCNVPIPIDESINITIQIARGLQKAHEKGIVHRDIKPANIMITAENTVKILDFGLAKLAGQTRLTKTGSTVGTAAYMSPEQAKGEAVDQRSDIWSVGVVMYEMLTGKIPFGGDYEQAMVYAIINEEPTVVHELNENVSAELAAIVQKCLAKDVKNRYQTVDDLLVDFKGFSKELELSFDDSLPKLLLRLWRKKMVRRVSAVAATLTLVTVAVLMFWPTVVKPIPIAIISFENQTGETQFDYLSQAIPNLLISSLTQSGRFRVVTWERLRDLLKQLGKDSVDFIDSELGSELCRLEGVPNIVVGSITKIGDMFATDLKILEVETKTILQTAQAKGNGDNSILKTQIDELTREVATEFGEISEEKYAESHLPIIDLTTTNLEAYKYYLLGKENFDAWSYIEARNNFTKAVDLDSTFAMAHIDLAYYYWTTWSPREMQAHLKMAQKYRSKASHKEQILLDFYAALITDIDLSNTINKLKMTIPLYPKDKQLFKVLGDYYKYKQDENRAIEFYRKVLELDPNHKVTLCEIGYRYLNKKNYAKALECIQKYVELAPNEPNPYDSMGDVYRQMKDYTKSNAMYQRALQIKPDFILSHQGIIANLISKGAYNEAHQQLTEWSRVARSFSDRKTLHYNRAATYIAEGDLDKTLREINYIDNLCTQELDTVSMIWNCYVTSSFLYENGRIVEAEDKLAEVKNYVSSQELSLHYYWHATRLALKKGTIDLAKEYAEIHSQKAKESENPIFLKINFVLRGLIAIAEEKYQKAIADLTQSGLEDAYTRYAIALVYIKTGAIIKARAKLEGVVNSTEKVGQSLTPVIARTHAVKQLAILKADGI